MGNEILEKLEAQDRKLEEIYKSVEKTRKYFFWTVIVTVVTFFLPLLVLIFLIPWFMEMMSSVYSL